MTIPNLATKTNLKPMRKLRRYEQLSQGASDPRDLENLNNPNLNNTKIGSISYEKNKNSEEKTDQ